MSHPWMPRTISPSLILSTMNKVRKLYKMIEELYEHDRRMKKKNADPRSLDARNIHLDVFRRKILIERIKDLANEL